MLSTKAAALPYYSFDTVFSHNAVYNFVVGARGLGKTYGAKKHVIKSFIRTGNQFIYLRRYKTELNGRGTFFADIEHEFPEHDFRVNGMHAEVASRRTRGEKKRKWEVMGYFMALSTASNQKSVAYPRVTWILYDEFIIEKGVVQYLPGEARAFNDLFSTVDRYKDKTRVIFMANSVSIMNPYFLEYDIKPDQEGEIVKRGDGFIVCHFPESAAFGTAVYATKFGKFIKDSDYADFAVESKFRDNHDNMVAFKPSDAKYFITVETEQGIFSVWVDWITGPYFYIQEKRPKGGEIIFTTVPELMTNGKMLASNSDKLFGYLRSAFRTGKAFFDGPKSRNAFIEVFRR